MPAAHLVAQRRHGRKKVGMPCREVLNAVPVVCLRLVVHIRARCVVICDGHIITCVQVFVFIQKRSIQRYPPDIQTANQEVTVRIGLLLLAGRFAAYFRAQARAQTNGCYVTTNGRTGYRQKRSNAGGMTKKKPRPPRVMDRAFSVVPRTGLEPVRPKPANFKSAVVTSFTTPARRHCTPPVS